MKPLPVKPRSTHRIRSGVSSAVGSRSPSSFGASSKLRHLLLLRHAGPAEAGDIGGFEQGVDLRHQSLVVFDGPQASEARKAVVAAQPAGLGEFGGVPSRRLGGIGFDPARGLRG
jgi:hypothetical protein